MRITSLNKPRVLHFVLLAAILALAAYIAFIPHRTYPYPLHVDEWVHMARADSLIRTGNVIFPDPFSGGLMGLGDNLEASFQLFWGVFQTISGIPWVDIFRFFPSVIFVITVLSVYIMAQRENFGLEAAFFTLIIPSTVGVLGPAFLVPVSMGLLFTPLLLFLALNYKNALSYILIFIIISFLLAIHAPSAISPIIILTPYILLNIKGNFKHSIKLGLAFLAPFLVTFPWIFSLVIKTARDLLAKQTSEYIQLPRVIETYGYIPILLCLLGTFTLVFKGGKKNLGLALGLLALLLMLVAYYSLHYGVPIVYERGLIYMMLALGVVAGAGLATIRNISLPQNFIKLPAIITQNVGKAIGLSIAIAILTTALPQRLATPYYLMIDKSDYEAFVWIKDNLDDTYGKAILDPWKATAFTAITGKTVYTRLHTIAYQSDEAAYSFIRNGSTDTSLLQDNNISIIYTRIFDTDKSENVDFPSSNPHLTKARNNLYLLK